MSTPAQAFASRANGQHSTGPRSVEGKAASSRNALKFGIFAQSLVIAGEDPDEFASLAAAYQEQFAPAGPEEIALVELIARAEWFLARYHRLECEYINRAVAKMEKPDPFAVATVLAEDAAGPKVLDKIYRQQRAAHRDWDRARAELSAIQTARRVRENRAAARPFAPTAPAVNLYDCMLAPQAQPAAQVRSDNSPRPQPAASPTPTPAYDDRALRL